MIQSIIFWDAYNAGMGGIERLIITLSEELSKHVDIKIIAKKEGIVYKHLKSKGVKFLHLDSNDNILHEKINTNDLLIIFGTYPDFKNLKKANPYICLWRVFPSLQLSKVSQKLLMRQTFKYLSNKNSLFFMDKTNWLTVQKELGVSFSKEIIPIPIKERNIATNYEKPKGHKINITYIGREEIWKIKPLKRIIDDAKSIDNYFFEFSIFTNRKELFIKELGELPKNIRIEYLIGYFDEGLSEELIKRSDLHFSMGTSALEGAILGIPTIIADASYQDFPDNYKYRWLIDDLENYAGVFINQNSDSYGYSLIEILKLINDYKYVTDLSNRTKSVVSENFSTSRIANTLLSLTPRAKLLGILKFMPSYWKNIFN